MVQPNPAVIPFCSYLQLNSPSKLTNSQLAVVLQVKNAAIDRVPVDDVVWRNFNLLASIRYQNYLVYSNFVDPVYESLQSACSNAWNFDNSSLDLAGARPLTLFGGTSFNNSGLINQCIYYSGIGQYSYWSPFVLSGSFTLSIWYKPITSGNRYFPFYCEYNTNRGFLIDNVNKTVEYRYNSTLLTSPAVLNSSWNHILIICNSGSLSFCINGVNQPGSTSYNYAGNIQYMGIFNASTYGSGYVDACAIFSVALSSSQIAQLYNLGAGLQYPYY